MTSALSLRIRDDTIPVPTFTSDTSTNLDLSVQSPPFVATVQHFGVSILLVATRRKSARNGDVEGTSQEQKAAISGNRVRIAVALVGAAGLIGAASVAAFGTKP